MVGVKRWIRRSPRRAALLTSAVLMALLLLVLSVTNRGAATTSPSADDTASVAPASPSDQTPTAGVPQSPRSTSPHPPVTPTVAPQGEHHRPDAAPVKATTTSYLSTFLNRTIPDAQWSARLGQLSTASHRATLATVPRSAVPQVGLRSVTVTRLASSAAVAAGVLTDGTVLVVALVLDVDGWKVSRVVPKTAGQ